MLSYLFIYNQIQASFLLRNGSESIIVELNLMKRVESYCGECFVSIL